MVPDGKAVRPKAYFPRANAGPYTVSFSGGRTTALSADGLELAIDASTHEDNRVDRAELTKGIPIWVDGSVVGHLVQRNRGFSRRSRALSVEPTELPNTLPAGHYFRLRGMGLSLIHI